MPFQSVVWYIGSSGAGWLVILLGIWGDVEPQIWTQVMHTLGWMCG